MKAETTAFRSVVLMAVPMAEHWVGQTAARTVAATAEQSAGRRAGHWVALMAD